MKHIEIVLLEDQNCFFTSDLHFFHNNIIRFCNRPYNDVYEMNFKLIQNWNNIVKQNDYIFMLGDFCFNQGKQIINKLLNNLHGKIYFLPGNHDRPKNLKNLPEHVILLDDIVNLTVKKGEKTYNFVLSHYPLLTWAGRNRNYYNLFGHIHTMKDVENNTGYDNNLPLNNQQYDVGVDNNYYTPISLEKVLEIFNSNQ